jgi:hypothetical protein
VERFVDRPLGVAANLDSTMEQLIVDFVTMKKGLKSWPIIVQI